MHVDWDLIIKIAMPIITLFLGALVNNLIVGREKVISYLGHIASFRVNSPEPNSPPTIVHTHSIIIKNAGRKAAKNVRLGHNFLPNINVYPDISYELRDLPGGSKEILFPTVPPKKEITISYLYFPPDTWEKINTHIESDEGPCKVVNVLLQPPPKPWTIHIIGLFFITGLISTIYFFIQLIRTYLI